MKNILNKIMYNIKKTSDHNKICDLFYEALKESNTNEDSEYDKLRKKCWSQLSNYISTCYDVSIEPVPYINVSDNSSYTLKDLKDYINEYENKLDENSINNLKALLQLIYINNIDKSNGTEKVIQLREKKYIFLSDSLRLSVINSFYLPELNIFLIYNQEYRRLFSNFQSFSDISDDDVIKEIDSVKDII